MSAALIAEALSRYGPRQVLSLAAGTLSRGSDTESFAASLAERWERSAAELQESLEQTMASPVDWSKRALPRTPVPAPPRSTGLRAASPPAQRSTAIPAAIPISEEEAAAALASWKTENTSASRDLIPPALPELEALPGEPIAASPSPVQLPHANEPTPAALSRTGRRPRGADADAAFAVGASPPRPLLTDSSEPEQLSAPTVGRSEDRPQLLPDDPPAEPRRRRSERRRRRQALREWRKSGF